MISADRNWLLVTVLALLGFAFSFSHSRAQQETEADSVTYGLEKGDSLRISSSLFKGRATLLEAERDTLVVLTRRPQGAIAIPLNSISSLEYYRRVPWMQRAVKGAERGALLGAGFGALGIIMSERGPGDPPQIWWPLMGAAIFAPPIAVVAAIIPSRRWEAIPLSAHARIEVEAVGSGLTVRFRW